LAVCGWFILAVTLLFHILFKENEEGEHEEVKSIKEIVISMKDIFKNNMIVFFLFFSSGIRALLAPISLSYSK
jgi:hypothetical protein